MNFICVFVCAESLVAVFLWLGFEIVIRRDCSAESMLDALDELRKQDHAQSDCVVCCVLTHGYEGGLHGVDGGKVLVKDLIRLLDGYNCPSLIQKPKLFFIQACQGSKEQQGVLIQSTGDMERSLFCDAEESGQFIPVGADFLLAMATMPGCVSFREAFRGTWFIQSLCNCLQQLVPR